MPVPRIIVESIRLAANTLNQTQLGAYLLDPIKRTVWYITIQAEYECDVTAKQLQSQSPKATGQLAASWRVSSIITQSGDIPNVQVRIVNDAPNAWYRIVGRAPGRMPPVNAIRQWCEVKGIPVAAAYPIARGIAQRGTQRWQKESNVLNYKRSTGTYQLPNPWSETIERIERAIQV